MGSGKGENQPLLKGNGAVSTHGATTASSAPSTINRHHYLSLWGLSLGTFCFATLLLFSAPVVLLFQVTPVPYPQQPPSALSSQIFEQTIAENSSDSFNSHSQTKLAYKAKFISYGYPNGTIRSGSLGFRLLSLGSTAPLKSMKNDDSDIVTFKKYMAQREPPHSGSPAKQNKLGLVEYILEYTSLCRHKLLQHLLSKTDLSFTSSHHTLLNQWIDDGEGVVLMSDGTKEPVPHYELINIVSGGPPENRIDVVFMGDGYTQSQRSDFIKDISRLSTEMFGGTTFRSWLPLINVWAVYIPSVDSGIGSMGKPKNTPFGLYRDGTELRGIYPSKPQVARAICHDLGPKVCDFPSLIANDNYYGGLGGEYIISTRSLKSGTVVLRHEMGHTFNEVGEEYDGGEVYEGVNSAKQIKNIPWKHWITKPHKHSHDDVDSDKKKKKKKKHQPEVRVEKNSLGIQDYSWHDLTRNGDYVLLFNSTGKFSRWHLQISTSGLAEPGSFHVYIDNQELPWVAPKTLDRTFSTWFNTTHPLKKGTHKLVFSAAKDLPDLDGVIHQLCNVELMEYSDEKEFQWDQPDAVSIYPTYDYKRRVTYRPTNEYCLMRNMTSQSFCPICAEGLWHKFMDRVSLIDELNIKLVNLSSKADPSATSDTLMIGNKKPDDKSGYFVQANIIRLAPAPVHRTTGDEPPEQSGNHLMTQWYHNDKVVHQLTNKTEFVVPAQSDYAVGVWQLVTQLFTPQVRVDPHSLLKDKEVFVLKSTK